MRMENIESSGPGHTADAVAYGCLRCEDEPVKVGMGGL